MVVIKGQNYSMERGRKKYFHFQWTRLNKKPEDKESREAAPQGSAKGRKGQRMNLGLKAYTYTLPPKQ